MRPPVLVLGLDSRGLLLEAPVLKREGYPVLEFPDSRALVEHLHGAPATRLVVLGAKIPDATLPAVVQRIRTDPATREVSVFVILASTEPSALDAEARAAGANAVSRRPLDPARLEGLLANLLSVERRIETRIPVQGQVVGSPRNGTAGHFAAVTCNVSLTGMLLASPVRLDDTSDLELEFDLPGIAGRVRALGRVVREAPEIGWPYIGYGIEFLFLPPESEEAISRLLAEGLPPPPEPPAVDDPRHGIRSTVRREEYVYDLREPSRAGEAWQVEIRRAYRSSWRPGGAGAFFVVDGASPEQALSAARAFIRRQPA